MELPQAPLSVQPGSGSSGCHLAHHLPSENLLLELLRICLGPCVCGKQVLSLARSLTEQWSIGDRVSYAKGPRCTLAWGLIMLTNDIMFHLRTDWRSRGSNPGPSACLGCGLGLSSSPSPKWNGWRISSKSRSLTAGKGGGEWPDIFPPVYLWRSVGS